MRLGTGAGVIEFSFIRYDKENFMVKVSADRIFTGYSKFHMDDTEFRKLAIKLTYKGYAFIDKTESYGKYDDEINWYRVTDFENWGRC